MQLSYEPEIMQYKKAFFLVAVLQNRVPMKTACEVLEVPLSTGYRWRQAFMKEGEVGLFDQRYGPRRSSMKRIPDYIEDDYDED